MVFGPEGPLDSQQFFLNGFLVSIFWGVTLLGATTSKTSGGTPRDLLETRCGALQVLSGRFTEDFGCEFGARFGMRTFVTEFLVQILAREFSKFWCEFLVWFFAEGAKPQNHAFLTVCKLGAL